MIIQYMLGVYKICKNSSPSHEKMNGPNQPKKIGMVQSQFRGSTREGTLFQGRKQ